MLPTPLRAVTFDCWATLMYEGAAPPGPSGRIRLLAEVTGAAVERVSEAFAQAWRQHQIEWHRKRAGIRRALICDTGFSPGPIVRRLLDRLGLLELLEVTVFSEEVGVPKPHPRAFATALDGLGVPAANALHVGDLRRSDIAGARAAGMRAIRYRGRNDDSSDEPGPNAGVLDCTTAGCTPHCPRPEGDAVVSSFAELAGLLGL